ncbi:formylglycine-generating enzyme family protein [Tenacibaculum sp. 1B UA]|uniref:formylglycine-generating enzyme family protein n=1 Tax=unclassified Tenacibaculum TaxID=2635139 RepID=UPI0026E1DF91|nr:MULTISPECIES: formylglycine-generating enzyme family protein [unclassified Tenacibaculum]MDO6675640.1 formylglycine-generating enzyme family protein [Tenacibaculum sp. 1_MG-2023]MDX8553072.1 formylglycine-generating enzyme family protein [Tenacibaculum sp. 1B UA]
MKTILRLTICIFFLGISNMNCQSKMVPIKGGDYIPLYGRDSARVTIQDFFMDVHPVTNEDFLQFVKENPKWRKSKVIKLFADKSYLINWKNDTEIGGNLKLKSPVTNISWFAAKCYCENKGKRLPTVDEWEYVGMANQKLADARTLKTYNEYILGWYEKPRTFNNIIGSTFKNYWGVYDMHGLVWEWTSDFNSVLVSGESRKDVDNDSNLFCGSAAIGSTDLMNYAAFMRYATRGSLKAKYTMRNLGFRCVKDKNTAQ